MKCKKIYVSGHRNPDVDSLTSACALADLRRHTMGGEVVVEALCPGNLPAKAEWVFNHFGITPPIQKNDVYIKVIDIVATDIVPLSADIPLIEALRKLEASGESSLPVISRTGKYLGDLQPLKLLHFFIEGKDLQTPVGEVPLGETLVLNSSDRVHDVKGHAIRSSQNHFSVLDESGQFCGTVLKRSFAEKPPYRMILVDHNETDQGILGLEELPVIEVVDHHRISFSPTIEPIRYTADIVGSTCTLVTKMYRASGLRPSKQIAGVLLAGVVADTLLFQSPTTTETDRIAAAWLEKICGETAQSLMDGMMSIPSPMMSMTPEAALESDRKLYTESGFKFSLSQIEESNFLYFHHQLHAFEDSLSELINRKGLDFAGLLITDPVRGDSEFLYKGEEGVKRSLPWRRNANGTFSLPGVLSRKKQLLPQVLSALSSLR
ncbi:MAG: DHH family phosphoesterase [Kiritimatiellae bacterium]|nr:DHH family phosphoesterase [Kiritimatiellia bacterium]